MASIQVNAVHGEDSIKETEVVVGPPSTNAATEAFKTVIVEGDEEAEEEAAEPPQEENSEEDEQGIESPFKHAGGLEDEDEEDEEDEDEDVGNDQAHL